MSRFIFYAFLYQAETMLININDFMAQPKVFKYYNGTDLTWFDSVRLCEEKGGVLAHFDTAHDHLFALKNIPMDGRVWIGYSDLEREGVWKTLRNEVASYLKWIDGQPDDRFRNEDCAMLVMGPWGRGRMMDAKCDETTGIEEWTIPASYLCRFDGPIRGENGEIEEREQASWATTVAPIITQKVSTGVVPTFNSSALREIQADLDVTQDRISDNTKEINQVKADLSDYNYDLQMITNSTKALKNDNKLIFEQMNNVLDVVKKAAVSIPASSATTVKLLEDTDVSLKSSVADEEQKFYVTHQKTLNKRIFDGLAKQKAQLKRLKIMIGDTESGDDIVNIEEFIEKQMKENINLRTVVQKLNMETIMLKRNFEVMRNDLVEFRNKLNG